MSAASRGGYIGRRDCGSLLGETRRRPCVSVNKPRVSIMSARVLSFLSIITLSQLALTGCVERECTEEERERAGADENDDCTRYVPLRVYTDDKSHTERAAWSAGDDFVIAGDVRGVTIVRGDSSDEVVVEWTAQTELADGREQDVIDATLEKLEVSLESRNGRITFRGDRQDSKADLGARINVKLPRGFDGRLRIDKTNTRGGDVNIRYLGDATELIVDMNEPLSDLEIADVDSLRRVLVNAGNDITINSPFGANLDVAVLHTASGDIRAAFNAAPRAYARMVSDFAGDVTVELPDDADFTLTALARGFGAISINGAPSGCKTAVRGEQERAMVCNDGDPDGTTFEIIARGDIAVRF